MKHQIHPRNVLNAKRAVVFAMLAVSSALLSGCNDDKSLAQDQSKTDQAAVDKHNAEIARKNEVRNQIK